MRLATRPARALHDTAIPLALAAASMLGCHGAPPGDPVDAGSLIEVGDAGVPLDAQPFRFDAGFGPRPDASFEGYPQDDTLTIFHVQLEATHNSYHLRPNDAPLVDWDYAHAPLDVQLEEQGVRGLEIDVHWDAALGAHRVYHLAVVDSRSTCDLFVECLSLVRAWSDAHPDHHPLVIHIEPKGATPTELRATRLLRVEDEIRSVWPEELVLTPDRVRAGHATLPAALAAQGWPTLGETRGQVLFAVDDDGAMRDGYLAGAPNLEGRLMFVDSAPGDPFGAYAIINNPFATERIGAALAAGFLVRVFGQDGVAEALAGDRTYLEQALASGAHVITSDFPAPVPETTFFVEMPGGTPSRCNPVTAPEGCTSQAIEDR
jgi:hypothetical protein